MISTRRVGPCPVAQGRSVPVKKETSLGGVFAKALVGASFLSLGMTMWRAPKRVNEVVQSMVEDSVVKERGFLKISAEDSSLPDQEEVKSEVPRLALHKVKPEENTEQSFVRLDSHPKRESEHPKTARSAARFSSEEKGKWENASLIQHAQFAEKFPQACSSVTIVKRGDKAAERKVSFSLPVDGDSGKDHKTSMSASAASSKNYQLDWETVSPEKPQVTLKDNVRKTVAIASMVIGSVSLGLSFLGLVQKGGTVSKSA